MTREALIGRTHRSKHAFELSTMSTRVALLDRLDALYDDDLVTLHRLFEELQLATVEAARADDFSTFACSARYFAAIQDTSSLPVAMPMKSTPPLLSYFGPWSNVKATSSSTPPIVSQAFPAENDTLAKNRMFYKPTLCILMLIK